MQTLTFTLPNQTSTSVTVTRLLNAGYAGRNQQEVQDHIDELAELGIPGPTTIPALYPVAPYLAMQTNLVPVQHDQTSGEAEWALVVTEDDVLLTVACDHTDRKLEVHGVAWSKNASPDVLGADAWSLTEIRDHLDSIRLRGWVGEGENEELIQDSPLAALLSPDHWLAVLTERGLTNLEPYCSQEPSKWLRASISSPQPGELSSTIQYSIAGLGQPTRSSGCRSQSASPASV